ncbi:ankyrin repeat domain-containing protein [Streptomyces ossamyceticus]|nr:ankyrin repeat domain-containing protein [Streptomyces ossamyceticus]
MGAALRNLWTPAHQAVGNGDADELARPLDSGADPNEVCCGVTLLAHAVDHEADYEADTAIQAGHETGVTLVAVPLAYGAAPRAEGSEGKAPPTLADEYRHERATRLLLRFLPAT